MVFFEQLANDYARRHIRLWVPLGCLVTAIGVGFWVSLAKHHASDSELRWLSILLTIGGVLTLAAECWLIVPMLRLPPTSAIRVTMDAERLQVELPSRYFGESFDVLLDDVAYFALEANGRELISLDMKNGESRLIPCASGLNLDRIKLGERIRELRPDIPVHLEGSL